MKSITYDEARKKMKPGDVIAFGGLGFISRAIKFITRCAVSHVGVLLQTNIQTWGEGYINQIIESTSLGDGFAGVQINRMSVHLKKYEGQIWWMPLSKEARAKFDAGIYFSFMLDQVGKKYDAPQAITSALDFIPDSMEDLDKLFCSELIAAGLEKAGVLENVNASEQTPADVCRYPIYHDCYQLKGALKELFM